MKIGHLLLGFVCPSLVWTLLGPPFGGPVVAPALAVFAFVLLGAFLRADFMCRSLGEALFYRESDAEEDEALHRSLLVSRWGEDARPRPPRASVHRCPLRRGARRAGARGPLRTAA
jgi:hypothetical protein